jgi:transposase
MSITPDSLPHDINALKALILQIDKRNEVLNAANLTLRTKTQELESENARLHQELKYFLSQKYGRKADVVHPGQGRLFDEAEKSVDSAQPEADDNLEEDVLIVPGHTKRRGKRRPLPASLERQVLVHDLEDHEKHCSNPDCNGCELKEIGYTKSEQLDIIPMKMIVLEHQRKKYACPSCESTVVTAAMPPQPIPKSIASPGLLAHTVVSKYGDALPLYRQEAILERLGIDLLRSTTSRWMIQAGKLVEPLIDKISEKILEGPVIHSDETPIQVLKETGKATGSKSYMWVMARGSPGEKAVIFNYHASRSQTVPMSLFADYRGYLQADGYSGYDSVTKENSPVRRVGCWAHVRRKFVDALKSAPRGGEGTVANEAVRLIKDLYEIEREVKDMDSDGRYRVRQDRALPKLMDIRTWLDKRLAEVLPKSMTGKALSYMDNEWVYLSRYVESGDLSIDNNLAERAIRPFAIGRKNWMFSDTPNGAKASAALYSLIETAKANGVEPYSYLKHVFTELPKSRGDEDITALLPWEYRRIIK